MSKSFRVAFFIMFLGLCICSMSDISIQSIGLYIAVIGCLIGVFGK